MKDIPEAVTVDITEEDIDRALADAALLPEQPSAIAVEYIQNLDVIYIKVSDGRRLFIPREEMQGLEHATREQLANVQIFGYTDIAWPDLDVDHYLPHLLDGKYATEKWKQSHRPQALAA